MRTTLCIALASVSLLALHCSSDEGASTEEPIVAGHTFDRIAQARMYINGERTLPFEEGGTTGYAAKIGNALASLHPTYVSGLIRHNGPLGGEHALTPEEIAAFETVRGKLPKDTKLDVVLSPVLGGADGTKLTPEQITHLMADIQDAVHPDIWFFDFFTDGDPKTAEAAIEWAHKTTYGNGKSKPSQLVGGHYFGSTNDPRGTAKANFFALVDDACGELGTSADPDSMQSHLEALRKLYPQKKFLMHVNNNAQNGGKVQCRDGTTRPETFACTWSDWSQAQRKSYVDKRASQQDGRGFTFMFPVFFPACAKGDPNADPLKVYYDAAHDGLLAHIGNDM
jgi:hypothetical protein